jgi:site-specific recombinase XerD
VPAAATPALPAVLPSFERSLRAARRSPRTIDNYVSTARAFISWLDSAGHPVEVGLIRREHVELWLLALEDRGNTPSTMASRYRCLQQLFRWLEIEEEIDHSPMAKMRPPSIPEPVTPVLSVEDQRELLKACEGRTLMDRRDLAIMSMFLDAGLRLTELADLKLGDVDLDSGAAIVADNGARPRIARFGSVVGRNLDRYIRSRSSHVGADSEWLSVRIDNGRPFRAAGIAKMIKNRGEQAGIEGLHPHIFRHTFARRFRSNGGSEGDLMVLGGWRSRSMIDRYGKAAAADRGAEAHRAFSPLDNLKEEPKTTKV